MFPGVQVVQRQDPNDVNYQLTLMGAQLQNAYVQSHIQQYQAHEEYQKLQKKKAKLTDQTQKIMRMCSTFDYIAGMQANQHIEVSLKNFFFSN